MNLSEANELLSQIRSVFPVDKRFDGSTIRVVASEVFDSSGYYDLAVRVTEVDDEVLGKIADVADRYGLAVRPTGDYWILDKMQVACEGRL